jgi:hypothetical protein
MRAMPLGGPYTRQCLLARRLDPISCRGRRSIGTARRLEQARGVRPESQAQVRRHGDCHQQCRQAARCRDRSACGQRTCGGRRCPRRPLRLMRQTALPRHLATPKAKLMAWVGEEFPFACPGCGGDIRLIAFITDPGPIRKILTHLGEPLEPPPVSPARGPPADSGELGAGCGSAIGRTIL